MSRCAQCGGATARKSYTYCSNRCQQAFQYEQDKRHVLAEGAFVGRGPRFIKRVVLELRGHQCEICRRTKWQGQPIPLELDHINGHAHDNRIENLRMACGNCAMQLPTYKGKNRGAGRHARRQRFRQGKSY